MHSDGGWTNRSPAGGSSSARFGALRIFIQRIAHNRTVVRRSIGKKDFSIDLALPIRIWNPKHVVVSTKPAYDIYDVDRRSTASRNRAECLYNRQLLLAVKYSAIDRDHWRAKTLEQL